MKCCKPFLAAASIPTRPSGSVGRGTGWDAGALSSIHHHPTLRHRPFPRQQQSGCQVGRTSGACTGLTARPRRRESQRGASSLKFGVCQCLGPRNRNLACSQDWLCRRQCIVYSSVNRRTPSAMFHNSLLPTRTLVNGDWRLPDGAWERGAAMERGREGMELRTNT